MKEKAEIIPFANLQKRETAPEFAAEILQIKNIMLQFFVNCHNQQGLGFHREDAEFITSMLLAEAQDDLNKIPNAIDNISQIQKLNSKIYFPDHHIKIIHQKLLPIIENYIQDYNMENSKFESTNN